MRIGPVRVSRLRLMGDPLAGAMGLFGVGSGLASRLDLFGRGKAKRARGVSAGKLMKISTPGTNLIQAAAPALPGGASLPPVRLPRRSPSTPINLPIPGGPITGAPLEQISDWLLNLLRGGAPSPLQITGRRRRRMNVLNPRALRRSITRVQGFARFARKTVQLTTRVKLKRRRRR